MITDGKKMLLACLLLLFSSTVFAGEECSMVGGICRDACAADEEAAVGAFLDCTDKQECCVKKEVPPTKHAVDPGAADKKDQN
jgi:hypothetical protein